MDDLSCVLVVDDDPDIRSVVRLLLEARGYSVSEAADGMSAISLISSGANVDLIILDVMMPGLSGYDVCSEIRKSSNAPILFLTAKTGETDRLEAYRSGGDDHLGKPFSQAMLLAKVSSLLRRYKEYKGKADASYSFSSLMLDPSAHTVSKDSLPLELTETEYNILEYLLRFRGSPVSAQELYTSVWNEKYMNSSANTVMVHILNLRKKIEDDASNPRIIRTVWGKGYQID